MSNFKMMNVQIRRGMVWGNVTHVYEGELNYLDCLIVGDPIHGTGWLEEECFVDLYSTGHKF